MTFAIKFTGMNGAARDGRGSIPPVGQSETEPRGAKSCHYGFHACSDDRLWEWFGPEAYVVELTGASDHNKTKRCAATIRVVRRIPWSKQDSVDYARFCADRVKHLRSRTTADASYADAAAANASYAANAAYRAAADAAAANASYAANAAAAAASHAAAAAYHAAYRAAADAADAAADTAAERRAQNDWLWARLRANDSEGLPEFPEAGR